jgi:murein DD-endopeptidase MepM/ murein hydrolase activator NlpD
LNDSSWAVTEDNGPADAPPAITLEKLHANRVGRRVLLHLRAHQIEKRPRYGRWIFVAFLAAFAVGSLFGLAKRNESVSGVGGFAAHDGARDAAHAPDVASAPAPFTEPLPPHQVVAGVLGRGETLAESLQIRGISSASIHLITREMSPVLDFRYSKPGDTYRLELSPEGDVAAFRYEKSPIEAYELTRSGDAFTAVAHKPEIVRHRARIAGLVSTSLYAAIQQLGESREVAEDFAEIFAWDVDFSRGVQRGDEFSILYERLYIKDAAGVETYVRPGQILAARYTTADDDHRAVYFESEEGRGAYYRPDGEPMERQFLKAPLDYKRISSTFTNSRFHPILKISRPHHGIDYAAPYGTSVWAVGNGDVIFKGFQSGFGNLVKVRHSNGYVSYYAHLSRFASDVRIGQRVHQKQVIGYVGSTGLSTGPHLCFRLAKEGSYVNPAKMHAASGDPIPRGARERFVAMSDELMAALDPRPLVITNEAL